MNIIIHSSLFLIDSTFVLKYTELFYDINETFVIFLLISLAITFMRNSQKRLII